MPEPAFAVVGHPNKGKSSLVATLARSRRIAISPEPGTTTAAHRYPLRVGDRTLYTLIDTPGFQSPRAVLDYLQQHEAGAASRPATVARFVAEHQGTDQFHDECELLGPLVDPHNPAAILYVVDGAKPYGPEYDAEMEVLRWTGRPSLAVINPIAAGNQAKYADQWRDALGQFFKVVRVLDALHAPFDQQIELLRAFAQLEESWRPNLEEAIAVLREDRRQKRHDAAQAIAELIAAAVTLREQTEIDRDEQPRPHVEKLRERYRGKLRALEREARAEVERIYQHEGLDRHEADVRVLDDDLFSKQTWRLFGLKRRDLLAVGAVSGAVVGGMADAALLGSSFLAGTAIGAVAGGALAYFGSDKLADVKIRVLGQLGRQHLQIGPTKNVQFPFVLLARALHHHDLIARRTHAQRDSLTIDSPESSPEIATEAGQLNPLGDADKRRLAKLFQRLPKTEAGEVARAELVDELADEVERLLEAD
ncbi:MAG: DUF3482 domain-containing protein [Planctomycetes bacterium]|jgi:GTPase Era involved in 16S rRNA processing|nr:DUF3482 domain-containing protein [Planctomycetota bacterium]